MKPRESKSQNLKLMTKNSDIKTKFLKICPTTKIHMTLGSGNFVIQ